MYIGVDINVDHVIADSVRAGASASEQSGPLSDHVYEHRDCSLCTPQSRSGVGTASKLLCGGALHGLVFVHH